MLQQRLRINNKIFVKFMYWIRLGIRLHFNKYLLLLLKLRSSFNLIIQLIRVQIKVPNKICINYL